MSLTTNGASLQSILAAVNALPNAGGGGSVATCNVVLSTNLSGLIVMYSAHQNGAVVPTFADETTAITDCVCGTLLYIAPMMASLGDASISNGEAVYMASNAIVASITAAAGQTTTITI